MAPSTAPTIAPAGNLCPVVFTGVVTVGPGLLVTVDEGSAVAV